MSSVRGVILQTGRVWESVQALLRHLSSVFSLSEELPDVGVHPVNFSVLPLKCYVALSGDHMVIKGEVTLNPEVIHRSHDALEATLMTQPETRVSRSFVSAPPPFFF